VVSHGSPDSRGRSREREGTLSVPKAASGRQLPLAEILASAPDAVVGIDPDGTIVFVNRQVQELFGYEPSQLLGMPVETLLPAFFRDVHRSHRARYLADPVTRPMGAGLDLAGRRSDGSEFPVDISLSAIQTDDGLVATAFVRNIADRKRVEAMFRALLDGAPDGIVVIDQFGIITLVNQQVTTLFGYPADELIGQRVEVLVPERFRAVHPKHRASYFGDPKIRAMGAGLALTARRKDGSEFPVDIALAPFGTDSGPLVSASVRDVTERTAAEHDAQQLREAQIRRRQALEINDSVVQGVATAVYALERRDTGYALSALSATLESARLMMDRLLEPALDLSANGLTSLVREHPATVLEQEPPDSESEPADQAADLIRVVIADDTPDMRLVLRLALTDDQGFCVVGEAADGLAAVEQSRGHQPDIVVLDLAMPVMDGLQAIPLIRAASPNSRIVVLSGYGAEDTLGAALAAGADAYVTKGRPTESLATLLRDMCPGRGMPRVSARTPAESDFDLDGDRQAAIDLALSVTAHELATPVTVVHGMLETLRERMDRLPSSVVHELLDAMNRHVDHISDLLGTLNDVRNIDREQLVLHREQLDLGALVADVVADLAPGFDGRKVTTDAAAHVVVDADPIRLRQVITNLITNAVKFSPAGAPAHVSVAPLRATAQVSVIDRGQGIPPEARSRLFNKFTRLTTGSPGMGLGLFISRGIIRAHGGELRLARSGPEGSVFTLEVPLLAAANRERRPD